MDQALSHILVLLVAVALALAPRPTAREGTSHPAASEAGIELRHGDPHAPGPGAAPPLAACTGI